MCTVSYYIYRDVGAVPVLFLASYIFEGTILVPDKKIGPVSAGLLF